jgi:integrase
MAVLQECPICRRKQSLKRKKCLCGEDLDKAKRSKRVRYWISYRFPGGKQRRELVGNSISEARDADGKRKAEKREGKLFEIKLDTKMTFQELSKWYLGLEKVRGLASFFVIELSLKKFNKVFGDTIVSKIMPADLENYQERRRKEGMADGTIDHEIGKTKTMIIKAFDNGLVGAETLRTFKKVKRLVKKNSDARNRILSHAEFKSLKDNLPKHLEGMVAMGYYTGMRFGEIHSLTWDQIDMKSRIICLEAADTKDRERRNIPICEELYEEIKRVPRAVHDPHVFQFRGKPVKNIRTGLVKACGKAGIVYGRFKKDGFVFHDLRHTFNTNMRKAGVPESVIMKITGHSTREMFDRYNTVDDEDTKNAVRQLGSFLQSVDQNVDQRKK